MTEIVFHTSEIGNLWYMHGIDTSGNNSNTYTNNHDVKNTLYSKMKHQARELIIGELTQKHPNLIQDNK